jgi:hypothetical protein
MTDELAAGYRRFREERWPEARAEYEALAQGQKPHTLIVACSDSRADPALISTPRRASCSWCATSPIWCRRISPTAICTVSRRRWSSA